MTTTQNQQQLSGEDIVSNEQRSPSSDTTTGDAAAAGSINRVRLDAALGEIDSLKREIAEREQTISDLRARIGHRRGGTMSPASDDRSRQAQRLDDTATHAAATGKRRDLLSYLRLRRKRSV